MSNDLIAFKAILEPIWDEVRFRSINGTKVGSEHFLIFQGQISVSKHMLDTDSDIVIFFNGTKLIIRASSCRPDIYYSLADPDSIDKIHMKLIDIRKRAKLRDKQERNAKKKENDHVR